MAVIIAGMKRFYRPLIVITVSGCLLLMALYLFVLRGLPDVREIHAGLALPSTRILDRHGRLLYEITPDGTGRNTVLALDAIPTHCINALVATEDANFYTHPGISVRGIARAAWLNLRGGEVVAGGSTITQQVARNLLIDPHARAGRTIRRKLREMVLALQLQRVYTKDEILALWLNQTDFGNLAFGIEAASQAYFGKSAPTLSLAECALLVGIPQSPPAYDPLTQYDAARTRQQTVLGLMVTHGYLTQADADIATRDELQFAASPYPIKAPHAVLAVWSQLEQDYGDYLYSTGLEVTTTIDLDLHNAAIDITRRQLDLLNNPPERGAVSANANNAALVAMEPDTGAVRVMLGSPDYFNERISGALNLTLTLRQPGSTLKPFTYAALMNPQRDTPWTAASMMVDVRTPFVTRRLESYVPANFDLREHGIVTVREALAASFNIPAVIALEQLGVQPFIQFMSDLGVESLSKNTDIDLAVTLGGGEVRLLNLTGAYAALANGGTRVQPQLIERIIAPDGSVLFQFQPKTGERVLDERVAFIITDILSDDAARQPGFGANSILNIGRPAAAKTGTTTDLRDNWVVGYTPEIVVGVWVGNTDYSAMIGATGLSGAGPIWHQFMRDALKNTPESQFERPQGLIRADVCSLSGMLPTDACTVTREEWFIEGTVPTEYDTLHQRFEIDTQTGFVADETTPPERRAEQVFVVLPPEARDWGLQNGIPQPPIVSPDSSTDRFRLRSPDPYTVYEISPMLPPASQRLRFVASVPSNTREVRYIINGELVAVANTAPFEAWWQLEAGEYTLIAEVLTNTDIQILVAVPFTVIPPQN